MKAIFKILALLCLMMGVLLIACACGGEDETTNTTGSTTAPTTAPSTSDGNGDGEGDKEELVNYTVRAVDAFGNDLEVSVIVEMFKDGESLGEMPIRRGSAVFKLAPDYYTFEVKPMEGEFYYNKNACVLDEETTEMTVTLYNYADEDDREKIWIYDESVLDHVPYDAVNVYEGGSYVTIDRPEMTYFIFTPTRGGFYKFSYESSKAVTIGYFGSPHNVLTSCPVEVVDGAFELEVKNESVSIGNEGGTTQIVLGIRSYTVKGCVLKIERTKDATVDLPFTDVQVDKNATKQDNYVNSEFIDFDVTDNSLKAVYNEQDGYYHLNSVDGPIIYVRISTALIKEATEEETIYAFLPPFITMCDTDRLCKYFFDEDGNVILKESYNDLFYSYAELCGTKGLYPLNEQLATVIKNIGEHKGWYDLDGQLHIFGENASNVVSENAWLFACVYENQQALGNGEKPAPVSVDTADSAKTQAVLLNNGVAVTLRTIADATLTITNAHGIKIVANNGQEYVADGNGKLVVILTGIQNFTILYEGENEQTAVHFTLVEYFG